MAGIPVHTSSPISPEVATKASAISPSTSAAQYTPISGPTTTSASPTGPSSVAQPGAAAVPQPTSAAVAPSNTAPAPTPTQPLPESSSPPAPQPGAAPMPWNTNPQRTESTSVSPHTASVQPVTPYPPAPLAPHQSPKYLHTPTRAVPPASVTSTYTGPQDLSHPPGYIQNSRASFEDRPYLAAETNDSSSPFSIPGNVMNRRSIGGAGILNGEVRNGENGGEEKSVWDTAATWAKAAGKKLSQAEEEVWKRVNGDK